MMHALPPTQVPASTSAALPPTQVPASTSAALPTASLPPKRKSHVSDYVYTIFT